MTDWMQLTPTTGVSEEQTSDGAEGDGSCIVLCTWALLATNP